MATPISVGQSSLAEAAGFPLPLAGAGALPMAMPLPMPLPVPGSPASSAAGESNATLYLGNLHPFVSEATLLELFAGLGGITELKVGLCAGCGVFGRGRCVGGVGWFAFVGGVCERLVGAVLSLPLLAGSRFQDHKLTLQTKKCQPTSLPLPLPAHSAPSPSTHLPARTLSDLINHPPMIPPSTPPPNI